MRILIVDDEEVLRDVLEAVLRREGFDVVMASSGEQALSILDDDSDVDLVILDIMLPGISGIDTLRALRIANPNLPVIVITAYSSIDGAIEAMKHGAFHYIPKPFKNEEVILTVNKALEQRRLSKENERLKAELSEKYAYSNIIGKSETMRKVFDLIRLAAPSRSNILIAGESGTGKELVAKAIHHASPRAGNRFLEDLYYRLNVITINLRPLRRKREDIPLLVAHFLEKYADENKRRVREVTPEAMRIMMDHSWPGNVRELENTIERAVVLCTGDRIGPELLPDYLRYPVQTEQPSMIVPAEGLALKDAVSRYERAMILQSLEMANGVQKKAAELLQLKPSTLNEMMKRLGIHAKSNAAIEDEVTVGE